MQIHRDLNHLPEFRNAVVTIGTFDGVHLGHRKIISNLIDAAQKINGETVIITFHPHPRKVIGSTTPIYLINTIREKTLLLEEAGIDHLVIVPFTADFSKQSASEYIENFLIGKFNPKIVIIGYDHRYGEGRKGDYQLLETYSQKLGFELQEIPPHLINENTVSSTRIRQHLLSNEVREARSLLGYDYFFEGIVVKGDQIGRKLGYPTANIQLTDNEKLVPANGIYAVQAELIQPVSSHIGKGKLDGMMSIGIRPTINGTNRMIEVNLFKFGQEIYGQTLRTYLKDYMRPELKFNSLDELKHQISLDQIEAEKILGLR